MWREIFNRALAALFGLAGLAMFALGLWTAISLGRWSPLFLCVGGLIFIHAGFRGLFPSQPPPLPIEPGDPLMAAATERARREFRRFEAGLREGRREALIKYAMKTGYADSEHVWAVAHAVQDGAVVTTLLSEPVGDAPAANERRRIPVADVEDWLLVDESGRMEGGFTQIAMAKIYRRDKGYVPWPIRKGLADFADLDDPTLAA